MLLMEARTTISKYWLDHIGLPMSYSLCMYGYLLVI